jgi:hypothetical protein
MRTTFLNGVYTTFSDTFLRLQKYRKLLFNNRNKTFSSPLFVFIKIGKDDSSIEGFRSFILPLFKYLKINEVLPTIPLPNTTI